MAPDPQPKKSIVLPICLTVLVSAIVFGGIGYYLGMGVNTASTNTVVSFTPTPKTTSSATVSPATSPTATTTTTADTTSWKEYAATTYGFSFKYDGKWDLRATRYPIEIELDAANIQTNHKSIYLESSTDATRIAEIENGTVGTPSTIGGLAWKSYTHKGHNPGELGDNRTTLATVAKQGNTSYIVRFAYNEDKKLADTDVQQFLSTFKITK